MIMSRRRRIYLLLALLLPTTLGVATFALVDRSGHSQDETWFPAMMAPEAAPEVVREAQSIDAPADHDVEGSGAAPTAKGAEAPATEPQAPASNQRPVRDDADTAEGPALFAGFGPAESFSGSEGPTRFASIGAPYAGGGGGGGSGSSKDPQAPHDPQDQQPPPQDPQVQPGDDTSPDNGKNQPGESQGGNSPGPNPPNNDGKQDEGGASEGGPNNGAPNPGPNEGTPGDEGGNDDVPPFIPDPEVEKPVQVPEPATLGLLALGLLGCAARRKARK